VSITSVFDRGGTVAAKSGENPVLSRNGEAPSGDESGRLPPCRDTSPRRKGGSCEGSIASSQELSSSSAAMRRMISDNSESPVSNAAERPYGP
jgi:hypothetical protein